MIRSATRIVLRTTAAGVMLFSAVSGHAQMGMQAMPSVRVQPAVEQEVTRSLDFTATIEPWRQIELSAQVAGLVRDIPIEEGQVLKAGELICLLDTNRVQIDVARAEAQVAAAQAELALYEAGYRTEEVEEARKRLEEAEARERLAREEWERQRELVEEGIVPELTGTRLRSALDEAQSAVAQARASLARLSSGYRTEEIAQARARLAAARAELDAARWQLSRHSIVAPADAVVVERLREPGEWVGVGEAVARLVVLDPLRVVIDVPQSYLAQVRPGQKATLTVDGLPDQRFEAEVTNILPQAGEASRNFRVLLRMANEELSLRSGLFARLRLNLDETQHAVLVPRSALQIRGDATTVVVADPIGEAGAMGGGIPGGMGGEEQPGEGGGMPGGMAGAMGGGMPGGAGAPSFDAILRQVVVRTGTEVGDLVAVEAIGSQPIRPGDLVVTIGAATLPAGTPVMILNRNEIPTAPAAAAPAGFDGPTTASDSGNEPR